MTKKNQKKHLQCFTLIEVLIFVSILSVFFVSTAAITTYMLRNLKIQEHKILATRYSQELLEWLKGEKEANWSQFITHTGTYCFNEEPINFPSSSGNCSSYSLASYFKREATLTLLNTTPPNSQMSIEIKVKWVESGGTEYLIPVNTIFTVWE